MKDLRHGASVTVGPPSGLVADVLLGDALLASILNDHTLLGEPVAFIPTRGEDRVNKRFAASVIPGIACTVRILIGWSSAHPVSTVRISTAVHVVVELATRHIDDIGTVDLAVDCDPHFCSSETERSRPPLAFRPTLHVVPALPSKHTKPKPVVEFPFVRQFHGSRPADAAACRRLDSSCSFMIGPHQRRHPNERKKLFGVQRAERDRCRRTRLDLDQFIHHHNSGTIILYDDRPDRFHTPAVDTVVTTSQHGAPHEERT